MNVPEGIDPHALCSNGSIGELKRLIEAHPTAVHLRKVKSMLSIYFITVAELYLSIEYPRLMFVVLPLLIGEWTI